VRSRIGQRSDDLQLLDHRSRPAVRDEQRKRVLLPGANMDEVDVDPSIRVVNCGKAFSLASTLRQS
jgi:hypothetical protein